MAEAEGGSEQDDVSFLRTVSNQCSFETPPKFMMINSTHGDTSLHGDIVLMAIPVFNGVSSNWRMILYHFGNL